MTKRRCQSVSADQNCNHCPVCASLTCATDPGGGNWGQILPQIIFCGLSPPDPSHTSGSLMKHYFPPKLSPGSAGGFSSPEWWERKLDWKREFLLSASKHFLLPTSKHFCFSHSSLFVRLGNVIVYTSTSTTAWTKGGLWKRYSAREVKTVDGRSHGVQEKALVIIFPI